MPPYVAFMDRSFTTPYIATPCAAPVSAMNAHANRARLCAAVACTHGLRRGFTMIEMVMVLAVVAVLALMAIPSMTDRLVKEQIVVIDPKTLEIVDVIDV